MTKRTDRWIEELVAALHHLDRRPAAGKHQPNIIASVNDLRDWLTDRRSYNRHHRQAWDSSFVDFRSAWASCGPRLRGVLGVFECAIERCFHELDLDRSSKTRRASVVETIDKFLAELSSDAAVSATWTDLIALSQDVDGEPELLGETVGILRDILRSRGSSTYYSDVGSRLQFLLVGRAVLLDGALVLSDDSPDAELLDAEGLSDRGPNSTRRPRSPSNTMKPPKGKQFFEPQLDSCLELLLERPSRDHFVVWFTIRQAWIPSFTLSLGAVRIFNAQWLNSLLFSGHRPSGYSLPAELEDAENLLSEVDFPADPKTLVARVDVGLTLPLFAVESGRDILQGLLLRAAPAPETWRVSKSYISFRNGKSAGFSYVAEDPPHFYVPDLDHVTRHLVHLEQAGILVDDSVDDVLGSNLLLRDELLKTDASSEVVQVITAQRALETLSGLVFAGDMSWIKFVRDYLGEPWCRSEVEKRIALVTVNALMNQHLVVAAQKPLLTALRSKIIVYSSGGHIRVDFDRLVQEAANLEALFQESAVAREISRIKRILSDGRQAAAALSLAKDELRHTQERLVRIRNAIAHGGPARPETVDTVSYFARSIAYFALGVTVDALLAGVDPRIAFEERRLFEADLRKRLEGGASVELLWSDKF